MSTIEMDAVVDLDYELEATVPTEEIWVTDQDETVVTDEDDDVAVG